jgi:tetratricopeptide (TPR) repeat protein
MLILAACGSNEQSDMVNTDIKLRDSVFTSIQSQEANIKKIISSPNPSFDLSTATAIYNSYTFYASKFPADTLTPNFLFKASDIASSALNRNDDAIALLDKVVEKYPNFRRLPECYFLRGFFCQKNIADSAIARKYFDAMIEKFPNHSLTEQANQMKLLLGKTDEQIIKEFEGKNK